MEQAPPWRGSARRKPADTASAHYSQAEAVRYTGFNTQTQHELASRCLDLLNLQAPGSLLLDIGCGSGLSLDVLRGAGHACVGIDLARDMLEIASKPVQSLRGTSLTACLLHADLRRGLPLRVDSRLDGAISVSALQWLIGDSHPEDDSAPDSGPAASGTDL